MKRKMYGAASVVMATATLAMPSTASAQVLDQVAISCGPGVVNCVQDVIDATQNVITFGANTARSGINTACIIIFGRSCS